MNVSNVPDFESTRSLPKPEFVARHPGLFLIFSARSGAGMGFKTTVATLDEMEANEAVNVDTINDIGAEVLALTKAPGNPYSERISLGRARNCDLVLRDASVSKLHAHFLRLPNGGFELADLDSQNGTLVDGRPLKAHVAVAVSVGSALRFGAVVAHLVDAPRLYDLLEFSE